MRVVVTALLRPRTAAVVSRENRSYALTRWPFVARDVGAALVHRVRARPLARTVTPKARGDLEPLPPAMVSPCAVPTPVLSLATVVGELTAGAVGYVLLCALGASTYAVVALAVSALHAVEAARASTVGPGASVATARGPLTVAAAALVPLAAAIAFCPSPVARVLGW